jgi:hypothetical protein
MEFVEIFRSKSGQEIEDMQRCVSKLTLDIICSTTFSIEIGAQKGNKEANGKQTKK